MRFARSGLSRYTLALPLLVFGALSVATADFLQTQNLSNVVGQVAALLIVALGQLVVAVVAGVDLSVGSVVSLAGAIVVTNADPVTGVLLALLLGVAVGVVNGVGVAVGRIHPLVMTLASMTFLQGLAFLILPIPGGTVPAAIGELAHGSFLGVPRPLLWCAACAGVTGFLLYRTRLGLHLFAVGANARSAGLNGVRVTAVVIAAYVFCSLMAVVAGIYLSVRVASADPTMGASFALESITAIALGGVQLTGGAGSVLGAVTGALSLGLLTNGINLFGVSPFLRGVVTGVLLLAAVCSQRRRLVGL